MAKLAKWFPVIVTVTLFTGVMATSVALTSRYLTSIERWKLDAHRESTS